MDLLGKFDAVVVKADNRISSEDRVFCTTHQTAYEHQLKSYKEIFAVVERCVNERVAIINKVEPKFSLTAFGCANLSQIKQNFHESHGDYIVRLVGYFTRKYKVTLDSDVIKKNLLPKEPVSGLYHHNEEEWQAYNSAMDSLQLDYNDILDQIFIQLDGCSFMDKAINELKEAAHFGAWNKYHGIKCFEQKKAVISFTSYACRFDPWHAQYYDDHRITFPDGMKSVIRALSHFECGSLDYYPYNFQRLLGYEWQTESPELSIGMSKVKSIKCFKNGRVDIRFTSEAYAREFIEDYLGLEA